jgi:hypothetical protein
MMKVRLLSMLGVVSIAAALSGCVSYGNTHALITPLGVAGYHKFKPDNTAPAVPQPPNPDRVAAIAANTSEQENQQQGQD